MSFPDINIPPLPDSARAAQLAAVVRHILSSLAGVGILAGLTVSDSTLLTLCSLGLWLANLGWSLWQKYQAQKVALHAVANANDNTKAAARAKLAA